MKSRPIAIKPPASFSHAGELPLRFDTVDPRSTDLESSRVDIDLRECEFVRPAAALWCVVFLALASKRGAPSRLLVPTNTGVCLYLKSLGLFDTLKHYGVDVDDRGIKARVDRKTIMPITAFRSAGEATDITNTAFSNLQAADAGAANLTSVVTELFGELTMNAAQHSQSEVGAFGCIQFVELDSGSRFTCTVADGGIGVYTSLSKNEQLRSRVSYDWDALELAVRERISGTGDPNRGIGLYGVSEDLRRPGSSLLLHSGCGSLLVTEELESAARRTRLFPGTLAYLSLPA